ncbi:MAG TPA: carbohydrate kinase family protein [Solirubrobacteraceae bacterium]|nr:carbohydrate kinase family protein [Solirubrobacteraceae bacterium]
MSDLDLLVLGDVNPDLVLADAVLDVAFGQAETLVDDAQLTIGGSGAIMACAAARLGLRTALVGLVGPDQFGEFMLRAVSERGVDVTGVTVDPDVRTGLTVVLARPGDRAILTFPGAIAAMSADRVDAGLLGRARHVHVSSFFLQTGLAPGLARLLAEARARGATTSVDPNWDPADAWAGGLHDLLRHVDVLLPNAVEACRLAGVDDPAVAAARLAEIGPLVAVKLGAEGAVAAPAGGGELVRATPPQRLVDPVDAVGAGDAFDAGLLCALLDGRALDFALAFACACGTLSMRAAGGTGAQATLAEARAVSRQA